MLTLSDATFQYAAGRGIAALPLELHWGPEGAVITVTPDSFAENAERLLGYAAGADELLPVREVLRHAGTAYLWRLNSGGRKAACAYAEAKHPGTRGNDLKIVIAENEASEPDAKRYDVTTWLGTQAVDEQRGVSGAEELLPNDFVSFLPEAELQETASTPLTGGSDGAVEEGAYQSFLSAMESYTIHAVGCTSTEASVTKLFTEWCKKMRDRVGKKLQTVLFRTLADYEGVVSVKNGVSGSTDSAALIPWATGVVAGTAVNASATNLAYDGELAVDAPYTQTELEAALTEGSWVLHLVDGKAAVLGDNNTLVTFTQEKTADFASNQTIRVLDQIANDIASLFASRYLGKTPNDEAGRISLWNDIVRHHQELERQRAIEGFSSEDVTVTAGETKRSVVVSDSVTPVSAMEQLYMTVIVQ